MSIFNAFVANLKNAEFEKKPDFDKKQILGELTKLYNQDLLCRKLQRWPLLALNTTEITKFLEDPTRDNLKVKNCLEKAKALCELFPDELFFAGGFILFCMGFIENYSRTPIPDVDFFVVAQSEERAITIITACIQQLKAWNKENNYYRLLRSDGALSYLQYDTCVGEGEEEGEYDDVELDDLLTHYSLKFQFIHRLYSHPSQIVGMFDLFPCGVLYSHKEGFVATPLAKYSIEKKWLFLDPTRASTSFEYRIGKYLDRGFLVCIPNLIPEGGGDDWIINNRSGIASLVKPFNRRDFFPYYDSGRDHWMVKEGFEKTDYQESDQRTENLIKGLYYHVPLTRNIPFLVKEEDLSVDVEAMIKIHHRTGNDFFPPLRTLTVEMIRLAFSGEKLAKVLSVFALEDADEARDRWNDIGNELALCRQEQLRRHFRPYREGGFFKIANPGEQGGGSFSPTVKRGSEFWSDEVQPIQVGISNEVYWLLKQICFENPSGIYLSKDIFRMLCMWCVIAQS